MPTLLRSSGKTSAPAQSSSETPTPSRSSGRTPSCPGALARQQSRRGDLARLQHRRRRCTPPARHCLSCTSQSDGPDLFAMDEICDFLRKQSRLDDIRNYRRLLYRHSILFLRKQSRLDDRRNYRSKVQLRLHAYEGKRGRIKKKQLMRLTFWEK
jgi:hypothetical protein